MERKRFRLAVGNRQRQWSFCRFWYAARDVLFPENDCWICCMGMKISRMLRIICAWLHFAWRRCWWRRGFLSMIIYRSRAACIPLLHRWKWCWMQTGLCHCATRQMRQRMPKRRSICWRRPVSYTAGIIFRILSVTVWSWRRILITKRNIQMHWIHCANYWWTEANMRQPLKSVNRPAECIPSMSGRLFRSTASCAWRNTMRLWRSMRIRPRCLWMSWECIRQNEWWSFLSRWTGGWTSRPSRCRRWRSVLRRRTRAAGLISAVFRDSVIHTACWPES